MTMIPTIEALPNPLVFSDGRPVAAPEDWPARRSELLEMLQEYEYGHLPPAPTEVSSDLLHRSGMPGHRGEATCYHYKLSMCSGQVSLMARVLIPAGPGPWPVIVDGDDCWHYLSNEVLLLAVNRGYAVATFNRLELASDHYDSERRMGLYPLFPGSDFGALAAWAWGYHRVIDLLYTLPEIDTARIAVTGHSRGGKTALLAGATDERVALTVPNDSGCCGAGCLRFPDAGGEKLADIVNMFPYWFSPRLREYIGREDELPFDQHSLRAAVAPRALLATEALDDIWASPKGTRLTHEAAREVYRFLGVEHRIGLHYRQGGHAHLYEDWQALLDFADLQFYQKPTIRNFDGQPG